MQGGWRVIIIHPEHEQAASLTIALAVDARFQCRTFTHTESALDYLDTETQDTALVSLWIDSEDNAPLPASIHERQAHLPIVALRSADQAEIRADTHASIVWPCDTETLIAALEMAIEIPAEERTPAIGMPTIACCAQGWLTREKRVDLAKTRVSPALMRPTDEANHSFTCYWLTDAGASVCSATIHDRVRAVMGRVIELDFGSQAVYLAARVPTTVSPRELIASLIGETTAYLFRQPAHSLNESERQQFLTFAVSQAAKTRAMGIATT